MKKKKKNIHKFYLLLINKKNKNSFFGLFSFSIKKKNRQKNKRDYIIFYY